MFFGFRHISFLCFGHCQNGASLLAKLRILIEFETLYYHRNDAILLVPTPRIRTPSEPSLSSFNFPLSYFLMSFNFEEIEAHEEITFPSFPIPLTLHQRLRRQGPGLGIKSGLGWYLPCCPIRHVHTSTAQPLVKTFRVASLLRKPVPIAISSISTMMPRNLLKSIFKGFLQVITMLRRDILIKCRMYPREESCP